MSSTAHDPDDIAQGKAEAKVSHRGSIFERYSPFTDLYDLLGLVRPYAFCPFTAAEIYFPKIWPFGRKITFSPASDIGNLYGKIILVTGGNDGIGKETVLQLARHDPQKIYIAARTESKAKAVIHLARSQCSGKTEFEFVPLDLSSLQSVKYAAEKIKNSSHRLDILILNAGIMTTPPNKTSAGHDLQLGTNYIGHFLLTQLLLPLLNVTASEENSNVRIISVSSEAYHLAPSIETITSTEKLCKTSPWVRYGASKAANISFAAELARRFPIINSVSLHPGIINTDLYVPGLQNNILIRNGMKLFGFLVYQDVHQGALNQLWAAVGAKKESLVNGAYYLPVGKLKDDNIWVRDLKAAKVLWDWTGEELKKAGYYPIEGLKPM